MLHSEAVRSSTLELLKSLQHKEYLNGFYLVGGTALALYYGHRFSFDMDLFSNFAFNAEQLLENIQHDYSYQLFSTAKYTLKGHIGDINVDIIAHRYPYLQEPKTIEDISLLSEQDIVAMKLNAISISGQRTKDFIDIYYAFEHNTISDMLDFYKIKYNQQSATHVLKSLIYFDDIDLADWPILIRDPELKWATVKKRIEKEVIQFVRNDYQ